MTIVSLSEAEILAGLQTPGAFLGPPQFTFSIPGPGSLWPDYAPGSEPFSNFAVLSANQAEHFRNALSTWDELIAPNFSEIVETPTAIGEIRVALTTAPLLTGFAYSGSPRPPGSRVGDIWIDHRQASSDFSPGLANGLYETFIHEIGHTLGLKHPFEAPIIPVEFDNQRFTVMSYSGPGRTILFSGSANSINSLIFDVPAVTPMVLDIAAVQAIYGADPNTRPDDSTYVLNQNDIFVQSVYDAGGMDVIDASDFDRRSIIDLMPGSYSSIGIFDRSEQIEFWSNLFPAFSNFIKNTINSEDDLYTFTDNFGISISTTIENAIGGHENDILSGNSVANRLAGGAGNDMLDGRAGADSLVGGHGNDSYIVDNAGDLVFESSGQGTDHVSSSVSHYLYANVENLTLSGSAAIFGVGNELANVLTGNAGENLLIAGAGIDTVRGGDARDAIFGEGGDDQLFGDAGVDYIVAGIGNDSVDGGVDADEIYGQDGDDVLNGGASFHTDILVGGSGNDTIRGDGGQGDFDFLFGDLGNDIFYVDTPADLVFEQAGEGSDTVFANINGAGFYLYDNIENLTLLGNTPFGVGNGLANSIIGNAQGNFLLGGAGDDVLSGMGGGDVLFGEAGADTFVFGRGTGGDVIGDFARGVDRIDLRAFGFTSFAQLQSAFIQNGDVGAINLGNGDLVVLHNVTMNQLTATDFFL